ncbi:MAG: sigma-54 dependent transcriptional regulator [Bacteroidota bacterium]
MKHTVYIVDDEPKIGDMFVRLLRRTGFDATAFVHPEGMLRAIRSGHKPDVILADLMMPGLSGVELIETLKADGEQIPVIIITAHSSVKSAVEAMQLGAFHYLQKPVNLEEMRALVQKAIDLYDRAPAETAEAPAPPSAKASPYRIDGILGSSDKIAQARSVIETLRHIPNTIVLIRGETGTGKNLVAKTIHHNSAYNAGRFVDINCAALPENLLEAELFGYEKGAFTDARSAKPGLLEVADGGTVFLDEIDSMSAALQAKMLSFLESRTFRRLGGVDDLRVTTRILCATNAPLEERVAAKAFRKDLFYRINVVSLHLPALREMEHDVLAIARAIVADLARDYRRDAPAFTGAAERKLLAHAWPGNVRELRNVLERALIFSRTPTLDADKLVWTQAEALGEVPVSADAFTHRAGATLEDVEREYILHTLQRSDQSYADVAEQLGISKKTLWEKRKRYDLDARLAA